MAKQPKKIPHGFRPGQSGNPAGRKKGSLNKATKEVRELAQRIVEDEEYLELLAKRVKVGKAPHMEALLWHYAFGKPKERHEHSGPDGASLFAGLKIEVVHSGANGSGNGHDRT